MKRKLQHLIPVVEGTVTMRSALFAMGLLLALLITAGAWAIQPPSSGRTTLAGRVVSVEPSEHIVTIEATDVESAVNAIAVGQHVDVAQKGTSGSGLSRRLMGIWSLALFVSVLAVRLRRPRVG